MDIQMLSNEYWWGGVVDFAYQMPYGCHSNQKIQVGLDGADQSAPLFLSNQGRYLWSEKPFVITFQNGRIHIESEFEVELREGFGDLKGAHIAAMAAHYPSTGNIPDETFFRIPQYNTWIEFMYQQNQEGILSYAHSIVDNGMQPGILMIDEGWSEDYGVFDFYPGRFSSPKEMVDELHALGFTVMVWVTPHISPDSNAFRELRSTDFLIRDSSGKFALREWWNGFSCILDLSNPGARDWFRVKLEHVQKKYGVDGFKFDAGDPGGYLASDLTYVRQLPQDHCAEYSRCAAQYPFNELRAVWNMGGQPLVCRIHDKMHSWEKDGLDCIIPSTLVQGIMGYYYGCPDMVGGGNYGSFLEPGFVFDEELYIRWMQASILCPMIQFSIAPWRVLSPENFRILQALQELRARYTPEILALARHAATANEPIVRPLDYVFPHCGYETETQMYMLGDRFLVVPMLEKGKREKTVTLPCGKWKEQNGTVHTGGKTVTLPFPIEKVYILERM